MSSERWSKRPGGAARVAREGICLGRLSPLGSRDQGSPQCPSESPEGLRLGRDQPGDLRRWWNSSKYILFLLFTSFFLPLLGDPPLFTLVILGIFRLEIRQIKKVDDIFFKILKIRKRDLKQHLPCPVSSQ